MENTFIENSVIRADVLIIGSGLAGLLSAILLNDAGARVIIASKGQFSSSNTSWAQGGLAAVNFESIADSTDSHLSDTLKAGAGLNQNDIASEIINAAPNLVQILTRLGVNFDKNIDGRYQLAKEGGHAHGRVLHSKDTTGRTISSALVEELRVRSRQGSDRLLLLEDTYAERLLIRENAVTGAVLVHDSEKKPIFAHHVILATGGAGQLYSRTTNPSIATADGVALAYRAGATLADLEFVQFHPTALCVPNAPAFLISEAVRGEGALLLDGKGERFVHQFHPDAELATRDVVSRAIHSTMLRQDLSAVGLDLRPIGAEAILSRFPNIVTTCRAFGIDPLKDPIPVAPAAHYFMGGVLADVAGRTNLSGLYCIGEVASTGLHGGNRLASNSLLEAGVMAIKCAQFIQSQKPSRNLLTARQSKGQFWTPTLLAIPASVEQFRSGMYEHASLTRSRSGLLSLRQMIASNQIEVAEATTAALSESNMLLIGDLIAAAAAQRKESRGAHFREDYPEQNDLHYRKRLTVRFNNWNWIDLSQSATENRQAMTA